MEEGAELAQRTWLRRFGTAQGARARVVCFPHAGGSAGFFRRWSAALPPMVDLLGVQYPGRGDRIDDPCVGDLRALADMVTHALTGLLDLPVVLFGHSLGAAVAFESAIRLSRRDPHQPHALLVSGRAAPSDVAASAVHRGPDDAIWAEIRRLGGTSDEIADNPEWRSLLTPSLRADFRASETYRPMAGVRLGCPVTILRGSDDPDVTEWQVRGWRPFCAGEFTVLSFPGGHFFLTSQVVAIATEMVRPLRAALRMNLPSTP